MNNFFYIMAYTHNNKVGFGITGNVRNRIFDYIAGSGELQSFKYLYYGPKTDIVELERTLKSEWKRYMWSVIKGNKWTLEILDPVHNFTAEDVQAWVNKKIKDLSLPIRAVKDEWLSYQGDTRVSRKYIDLNPNLYLEP
jgi:predicted GIY-YIG superfamily endonuclease